jgi:hypothetical protein
MQSFKEKLILRKVLVLTFQISSGRKRMIENPKNQPIAVNTLAIKGVLFGSAYFHTRNRVTRNRINPSIKVSQTVINIYIFKSKLLIIIDSFSYY